MGLKGDLVELRAVWRDSPWRIKVFLCLSGFLATSSIASLSDVVFKWKGFFADGVTFYRSTFSDPFAAWASRLFDLSFTTQSIDLLFIILLIFSAFFRGSMYDFRARKNFGLVQFAELILISFSAYGIVSIFFAVGSGGGSSVMPQMIGLAVGLYLLLTAMLLFLPHRRNEAWRLLTIVWLIGPPLIVCIAAAINSGLSRESAA